MNDSTPRPRRALSAAFATDPGRVRAVNQDACRADVEHGLFIVADGLGGHHAGGLASQIVIRILPALVLKRLETADPRSDGAIHRAMTDAVVELSGRLREETQDKPGLAGAGATVVLLLVRGGKAHFVHMGDSRAALFRDGRLQWLTRDHSVVRYLVDSSSISEKETRTHTARGKLSRYVGMDGEPLPEAGACAFRPGDLLLLCSDGLTGAVEDEAISRALAAQPDLSAACAALVRAANDAGGKDNVTVVLARAEPGP
jgi:protein phosphatase